MFVVAGLIARRSLLGGRATSWPVLISVALAGIGYGATFTLASFEGVSPIFNLPGPVQTAFMSLSFVWLATLLLPPALLIWSRRSDARADPGRLATAAVASFVPSARYCCARCWVVRSTRAESALTLARSFCWSALALRGR
jgi:hypothetical protein